MTDTPDVQHRVDEADSLADVLDAAYAAYEQMLSVIDGYQDGGGPFYAALVMAAAAAANGRNAIARAPSLPRSGTRTAFGPAPAPPGPADWRAAAATVAALSDAVARRLRSAAADAEEGEDRTACLDAARHADQIHALASGGSP